MKRVIQSAVCAVLLAVGAQAFADDTTPTDADQSATISKNKKIMRDCMKEQASMNPGMDKSDMKKACNARMMKLQQEQDRAMAQKSPQ